ncbi:MAG: chromate resistance protein ChrB domain-containing protein [Methylococcaceae bacterium]
MDRPWLILIISLPTQNATKRMRVWRALKALGCCVLRDGVYLLPHRPGFRQAFQVQAEEVKACGGNAHLLFLDSDNQEQQSLFEALFDRSDDYAKLLETLRQAVHALESKDASQAQRRVLRFRKDFEVLAALDFFPGAAREQVASVLEDMESAISARQSPDEPHSVQRRVKLLQRQDYQGRLWTTRQRPWIDRLASAWLIRRFIDTEARFIWLASLDKCPSEALGFDFDGAAFTHTGAKVTFEVLCESFGLIQDTALNRIGALVHFLDVGGVPVPEAAGLETLIVGMQQRWLGDDELLAEVEKIFDAFYQAFSGNRS